VTTTPCLRDRRAARRPGLWAVALATSIAATSVVVAGCVEYAFVDVECPPFEDFAAVSPLLESRCGTLDCHGSTSRPLRLYGQYGLRLNPGEGESDDLYSGNLSPSGRTTAAELEANYRSVCGLEPEKMTSVARGELESSELTMVRKPRLSEKHKGGRIWNQGKPADRCLVTWLEGQFEPGEMDDSDCTAALQQ
jgi:hypothetical protein